MRKRSSAGSTSSERLLDPMTRRDAYRRIAPLYDRVVEPMQAGVRRVVLDVLPPQPGWQILDVGCGTGTGLLPYLEAGCTVSGVDVSPAMLAQATTRLGDAADLRLTDPGEPLPADDDTFDLTLTTLVLHEVPAEERVTFVQEMARVTKREGRMVFVDFHFGSLRGFRGRTLRAVTTVVERLSGHYAGYRSFRAGGGLPAAVTDGGLAVDSEKIVAGGNMAIYVVS